MLSNLGGEAVERESQNELSRYMGTARKVQVAMLALLAVAFIVSFVAFRAHRAPVTVANGTAVIGAPAPAFTTQDLGGKKLSLSDYWGRPVLLNFWATTCTACQDEMPAIQAAWQRHQSQGVQVLAVDYREVDVNAMKQYLSRLHVTFRAALDEDGKIARAYGVAIGLPVSVFVDRQGKVAYIHVGAMSPATIEAGISKVVT